MSGKIITFRANYQDLELINQIKEEFKKQYLVRTVTTSDILSAGISVLWNQMCLPYKDEKPYKYRAEKDIPFT